MMTRINEFLQQVSQATNSYLGIGVLIVITTILASVLIYKKSERNEVLSNTKLIVISGVFSSLAFILMYFGIPLILPFLKIEFSFAVIFLIAMIVDMKTGITILLIVSILDYIVKGSQVGIPIDQLAYFIASLTFLVVSYYTSKKYNKLAGVVLATVVTAIVMTLLNYAFITPFYIDLYTTEGFWGYVGEVEPKNFFMWCVRIYMPFNLIKWGLVSVVTLSSAKAIDRIYLNN